MGKLEKIVLVRTAGTGVALSADAAKLPHRIKILNWGDNPNCHGRRVNVGPLFAKCLGAETYPYRKVALDFEHNTFPGTAAYRESREPRPVEGFGAVEAVEGEGVYITMSGWTPEGKRMASHYADVSAGAVTDGDGNVVAVASVALCRAGAVDGMDFVEAPLSGGASETLDGILRQANDNKETKGRAMDYKALLIKSLGLGDDATDEAVQAALAKALEGKKPGAGDGAEKEAGEAAIAETVKAAVAEAVKPIEERVAALSAAALEHEKADLVAAAAREGKVVALGADALAKLSVEDLKATIAKTAVTVPLSAKTPATVKETAPSGEVPDEFRRIALNCGVSPDIFRKQ